MQIVIDIPESCTQNIDDAFKLDVEITKYTIDTILDAVTKGIVLPKNHGRLIDADKAFDVMMEHIEDFPDVGAETYLVDDFAFEQWLKDVPTIIEADKAESEVKNDCRDY